MEQAERETTIQWCDLDEMAHIFTAQPPIARRLKRIRGAQLVSTSHGPKGEWWGEEWEVPIKAVLPRNPPKRGPVQPGLRDRLFGSRKPLSDRESEGQSRVRGLSANGG